VSLDPLEGRVLVVDDHEDTRDLFVRSLTARGCRVLGASGVEEAVASIAAAPVDAVITDVKLPGRSGIDLCRQITAATPDVPVIVITGYGSLDTAVAAMRAGAYDFITKPVDLDVLAIAVRRALQHHALLRERMLMQARLLQADRLVSLGTLAAGAAHEINNPLTYVMLSADAAMRGLRTLTTALGPAADGPPLVAGLAALRDALPKIHEGSRRIREIVANLKTFSRGEVDVRSILDVNDVVDSSIAMVMHEVRPRARVIKTASPVHPVEASEARLAQVFINLLINAAHAIPPGDADHNEIRVATGVDASDRVFVEIGDTGAGIDPALIGRIFDPFFTTKSVGDGTGLGLSICLGIVTALGGEITVRSVPGVGSTFRVVIPRAAKSPSQTRLVAAKAETAHPRHRVLVVDDEPMIGASLGKALAESCETTALTDAAQALALVASGLRFDAILCDISMPRMTGMAFYEQLRAVAADQAGRVIFMTGGAFTPSAQQFLERVPTVCIEKPLDLGKLLTEIRRVAARGADEPRANRR
jgi:signal transduction histidine kinase